MNKHVDTCSVFTIISTALGVYVINNPIKIDVAIFDPLATRNRYMKSIIDSLIGVKFGEFKK